MVEFIIVALVAVMVGIFAIKVGFVLVKLLWEYSSMIVSILIIVILLIAVSSCVTPTKENTMELSKEVIRFQAIKRRDKEIAILRKEIRERFPDYPEYRVRMIAEGSWKAKQNSRR